MITLSLPLLCILAKGELYHPFYNITMAKANRLVLAK